jgi:hypothetical protein
MSQAGDAARSHPTPSGATVFGRNPDNIYILCEPNGLQNFEVFVYGCFKIFFIKFDRYLSHRAGQDCSTLMTPKKKVVERVTERAFLISERGVKLKKLLIR